MHVMVDTGSSHVRGTAAERNIICFAPARNHNLSIGVRRGGGGGGGAGRGARPPQ